MKCPCCGDAGPNQRVSCRTCRQVFESDDADRFNHLEFMLGRLDLWRANQILPEETVQRAIDLTTGELNFLQAKFGNISSAAPTSSSGPTAPTRYTSAAAAAASREAKQSAAFKHGTSATDINNQADTGAAVSAPVPGSQAGGHVASHPASVSRKLNLPRPVAPPRPPQPTGPPFSWKQVGLYLISERVLNGLLAIGAFLILSAAVVISTVNPTGLTPLPHLGMMLATTAVFYIAGILVERKLKLTQAGAALLAIGAAFIPLDTWTLGAQILHVANGANWLVASMACLPLYLASYLTLRSRSFAVLTAVAGMSLVLAIDHQVGVPTAWIAEGILPLAIAYLLIGYRVQRDSNALAWALFWTAQVATPVVMAYLLAAKILPDTALDGLPSGLRTALLAQRGAALEYAAGAAWWLGTVFYLVAGRVSERKFYWISPPGFYRAHSSSRSQRRHGPTTGTASASYRLRQPICSMAGSSSSCRDRQADRIVTKIWRGSPSSRSRWRSSWLPSPGRS